MMGNHLVRPKLAVAQHFIQQLQLTGGLVVGRDDRLSKRHLRIINAQHNVARLRLDYECGSVNKYEYKYLMPPKRATSVWRECSPTSW